MQTQNFPIRDPSYVNKPHIDGSREGFPTKKLSNVLISSQPPKIVNRGFSGTRPWLSNFIEIMYPVAQNPDRNPNHYELFLKNWEDYYKVVFQNGDKTIEWSKKKVLQYNKKYGLSLRFTVDLEEAEDHHRYDSK